MSLVKRENVEFYLDNGELFSYTVDPSRILSGQLSEMVDLYMTLQTTRTLDEIYVTPKFVSQLNKEVYSMQHIQSPGWMSSGMQSMHLTACSCTVKVLIKRVMPWQVFVGTPQEYENNDFSTLLNRVLSA